MHFWSRKFELDSYPILQVQFDNIFIFYLCFSFFKKFDFFFFNNHFHFLFLNFKKISKKWAKFDKLQKVLSLSCFLFIYFCFTYVEQEENKIELHALKYFRRCLRREERKGGNPIKIQFFKSNFAMPTMQSIFYLNLIILLVQIPFKPILKNSN